MPRLRLALPRPRPAALLGLLLGAPLAAQTMTHGGLVTAGGPTSSGGGLQASVAAGGISGNSAGASAGLAAGPGTVTREAAPQAAVAAPAVPAVPAGGGGGGGGGGGCSAGGPVGATPLALAWGLLWVLRRRRRDR